MASTIAAHKGRGLQKIAVCSLLCKVRFARQKIKKKKSLDSLIFCVILPTIAKGSADFLVRAARVG
jgi:hypothetical protein